MKQTVPSLKYERYTLEQGKADFERVADMMKNAKCADDVVKAREEYLVILGHVETAMSLMYCRFTLNTHDEFYIKEKDYYDETSPFFDEFAVEFGKLMLETPFRQELIDQGKVNPIIYKKYDVALKAHSPENIEDEQLENTIVTEYANLMSQMLCTFRGEEMPLSVLRGKLSEGDREVRKEAAEAIGLTLEKNSAQLDDIFDRLVKVRDRMAKRLGMKSYTELGYLRMERIDYNREMVEKFRKNVLDYIVPVVSDLKKSIAKKLGWDKVMFYDNDVYSNKGDEKPILDKEGISKAAAEMYDAMNPEIGAFMHSMIESEAFDVDAREGKWGGGYCTEFADFKQTFILANFNGSSDDISTITHEFGHAFAMSRVYECGDKELAIGGNETAECHSMSMEFLSWKYLGKFFADADAYKYKHLCDSLTFIPYGVIVDEFQHRIYDEPTLTPAERKAVWRELEAKYRPYMTTDGIPYLELGTRWQYQMHIYETPFYYIDYCLAQTVALGFLAESRKDYASALSRYVDFCKAGGTKPFSVLVKDAGIANPFADGALKKVADCVEDVLKELK